MFLLLLVSFCLRRARFFLGPDSRDVSLKIISCPSEAARENNFYLQNMSRTDDDGAGQRDQARNIPLKSANWETGRPQARTAKDSGNVSPRSQGEIPLCEKQTEEIRRKIEEVKARASPVHDLSRQPSQERVRPVETSATTAPAGLGAVPPELVSELRKIIREEFVQLNKADVKDECIDEPQRPSLGRERPSSPIRPFVNMAGGPISTTSPSKEAPGDKRTSSTAPAPSPTTVPQKVSPRQSTVRFSDETKPAVPITPRVEEVRKASPTGKDLELTTIDKRWGILFDKDGTPTKRMQHVLKGLAKYIVDEFMPQDSIVITPEKMAAFYSHHRLDRETFTFAAMFKSRPKDLNEALANLYDDMGCQYFLVKADDRSRPSVPSLTPAGFVHWLVTMIQAYPDEEAKRLDKVVSALPIESDSLLDGKPERLPKQISRYLLPEKPLKAQQRLVDESMKDFKDELEMSDPKLSRRSSQAKKSNPIVVTTSSSDKRLPTNASGSQSSRYVPESSGGKDLRGEDAGASAHDRDRRNPSSAVGSGRDTYDDDRNRRGSMPPPPPPGSKLGRTGSIDSSGRSGHGSSREAHTSSSSVAASSRTHGGSSSSSRKNRSPQRKSYSQSVPAGLDRDDIGNDRYRSSGGISPAAVHVANAVLGSSSASSSAVVPSGGMSSAAAAVDGISARDARRNSSTDFGTYRDRQRSSVDDSAARTSTSSAHGLRDRADLDEGSSSRSSKRRSMVLPDVRGPTWDDYLKSAAPKSASPAFKNATSAFLRRGDGG